MTQSNKEAAQAVIDKINAIVDETAI